MMTNLQYAASLRAIADFYEQHPAMPQQSAVYIFTDKAGFLDAIEAMQNPGATVHLHLESTSPYPNSTVEMQFEGLTLQVNVPRNQIATEITTVGKLDSTVEKALHALVFKPEES
jgi:hypothetical protein